MYLGSYKIDDVLTFYAQTQRFDTGVATDADGSVAYRVYEDETATPLLTGTMATLDAGNTDGYYSEQITLSAANGFEKGKCYSIRIAATVNSVAGATLRQFQVEAEVDANRLNWANVDNPTTANNLSATNIDTDQVVASVTGAVGSVTGNVGGNVTGSVGSVATGGIAAASFAAGAIDASAIAANAIGASELATDAVNEIADGILNRDMSTGTDSGSSTVRTMRQALRFLRNKWSISGTTLTVYKEDDASASHTAELSTTGGADPVTGSDPAGP